MGAPIIPAGLWAALRFAHNPAPLSPWPVASLGPLPAHRGPSLRSGPSRLTVARRFARAPPGSPWPVASLGPLPAHRGPSLRSGPSRLTVARRFARATGSLRSPTSHALTHLAVFW